MSSPVVVQLALQQQAATIAAQVTAGRRTVLVDLACVPGNGQLTRVQAWRAAEPNTYTVEVFGRHYTVTTPLLGIRGCKWYGVTDSAATEVAGVDAAGRDVVVTIDARHNCWRMACPRCGRARYTTRNNIRRVYACRVCTAAARRAARTEWQHQRRRSGSSRTVMT